MRISPFEKGTYHQGEQRRLGQTSAPIRSRVRRLLTPHEALEEASDKEPIELTILDCLAYVCGRSFTVQNYDPFSRG